MQNHIYLFLAGLLLCSGSACQPDISAMGDEDNAKTPTDRTPTPDKTPVPEKTPDVPDEPPPVVPDDSCQWANDGICDEPTYCALDTDVTDCSSDPLPAGDTCEYANDGECDEPTYCAVGTDLSDCSGVSSDSCEYANDDVCDEPTYCAVGTDSTDCAGDGGGDGGGPDSCEYANDGACDEPAYCADGTDTTDCADNGGGGTGGSPSIDMGASCQACAGDPACITPAADDCGSSDTAGPGWCISAFGSQGTCTQSCTSVTCPDDYGCVDLYGGSFCIK